MGIKSVVVLLGSWVLAGAVAAQAVAVPTLVVASRATGSSLLIDGTIEAVQQSTLAAQVGGSVIALLVKAGDRVRAGQVLVRVDDRDAQAGVLRGEAGVAQAEAEHRQARMQAERTRELRAQGFVSAAALDQAEAQLQAARAVSQQADAARSQARLARGFTAVTAAFDGLVLATHVQAGDLATPGRPLVTVYRPGEVRAVVHVAATSAALARNASSVAVQSPQGRWVTPARLTELPVTDPVSQTVEWRLDLPATAAPLLRPGQAVRVRFDTATPAPAAAASAATARIVVPASAVVRRGELTAVYVAQGEAFALRAVRLGAAQGEAGHEVLAGLQPGERVAVDGVRAGLAGAQPQR